MIRFAQPQDFSQIRTLWETCFPDTSGFNDYYFAHLFCVQNTIVFQKENQIAAMLQMLPYQLRIHSSIQPVTYIYGACTSPDFRRQRFMSALLEFSFAYDREQGRKASILIPQEEWLFSFYQPFGYQPAFYLDTKIQQVLPLESNSLCTMTLEDLPACAHLYAQGTQSHPMAVIRTDEQWQQQYALFSTLGAGAFVWKEQNNIKGYAFAWREENCIWVQELYTPTPQLFLSALAAQTGETAIRFSTFTPSTTPFGCIKFHHTQDMTGLSGYLNLMLN